SLLRFWAPLHFSCELFKMMTGADMLHVPYRRAGPMLTDLLGGQVQVAFDPMPSSIGYVKAGQLRPLAVTTATRSEALPDLPSVGDAVAGYEASTWYGVGAPKNTPAEVIDRLNKEINAGLADPQLKTSAMELARRQFLHLVGIAAALPALSRLAWAQGYPTRPVHWIVSFTAGGPNDTVARIIGQYLSEQLGQQFIIENKVGAGGNI